MTGNTLAIHQKTGPSRPQNVRPQPQTRLNTALRAVREAVLGSKPNMAHRAGRQGEAR
jgi:hypothetical protein